VNPLPWLLDWPPSPAKVVFFVVVTTFSVGTLVLFGGAVVDDETNENVTVEEIDLTVKLNDEMSFPEGGNGTVQTCMASGTPGDSISVLGDVAVEIPPDSRGYPADRTATVEVSLAHTEETTTDTVDGPGRETMDVFWLLDDDETLSVGDTETVQVWVRIDGTKVASTTRNVTVEEGTRNYDC
jgi:hypothetical protein